MNFKTGDKVTVKDSQKSACDSLANKNFDYLVITEVISEGTYGYTAYLGGVSVDDCFYCYKDEHLEPYDRTITWDSIAWKDFVLDGCGNKGMVLAVVNDMVCISYADDFDEASGWFHKKQLQKYSYTIEGAAPAIEEITVAEAEARLGVKIKTLNHD